jgi:hypothetical protein
MVEEILMDADITDIPILKQKIVSVMIIEDKVEL